MKVLSIIPALAVGLAVASPVMARPVVEVTRGGATAIRACGDAYAERDSVCYNRILTVTTTVLDGRAEASLEIGRARRVRCDVQHPANTERAALAAEFCPAVEDGSLAPAPFLL